VNIMSGDKPVIADKGAAVAPEAETSSKTLSAGCTWFVALLAAGIAVLGFLVVILTSGTQQAKGVPRVAVVVLEGFKGTSFDQLMALDKLPNIAYLAAQGTRSMCTSVDDARCARTQSGLILGPQFTWASGPGLASILTGVNADKHLVGNDTFDDYSKFAKTSQTYPTMLATARANGFTTQVIGASHLLTSPSTSSQAAPCTLLGVADFECGTDAVGRCSQTTTCNINQRVPTVPVTDFLGTEETALETLIAAAFSAGTIADLMVIHSNKLSRLATDASIPTATFDASSPEYAAEAYVLDSIVGQLSAYITQRVVHHQENWLVLLTSDHGGVGKGFGSNTDQDEVIPFVVATLTANGNLMLNTLKTPTTQMDVAPTVLSWLGLTPTGMDGSVQAICSNGVVPADCTA
jgi:hypothetical protein